MQNEVIRPIDGNALLEKMQYRLPVEDDISDAVSTCAKIARRLVEKAETLEYAPVKPGRWLPRHGRGNNWVECSECQTVGSPFWKCCPVCEAKMEVGGDGN